MLSRVRLLFLCTGNSCRSQMAEGWTRHLKGDQIEVFSAGTHPSQLDPRARAAMAEVGVDISAQTSKPVSAVLEATPDHVVTVCDGAREACPIFPGHAIVHHVGFDDPPHLAREAGSDAEALRHYRRVRDEIRAFVDTLPDSLCLPDSPGDTR